jgi:imidazolonepropionase-like amidohydrolase
VLALSSPGHAEPTGSLDDLRGLAGRWDSNTLLHSRGEAVPSGSGHSTIRIGPGDSIIIDYAALSGRFSGFRIHQVISWDTKSGRLSMAWVDSFNPGITIQAGRWRNGELIFEAPGSEPRGARSRQSVLSISGPDRFTIQSRAIGDEGRTRPVMTLDMKRVADPDGPAGSVLISDVRLFDGAADLGIKDVLVLDGKIARIAADISEPAGIRMLDGKGKTLVPGLLDAHAHLMPGSGEDAVRFGVTTIFDMFNPVMPGDAQRRRGQRESTADVGAADTWSAGNGVTPPGGHPTQLARQMGIELPTLASDGDVTAFVEAQVAAGSDYIKIFQEDGSSATSPARLPRFPPARLKALIDAAHAKGRKAIVHVSKLRDAREAAAFGADALAHVWTDEIIDDATLALLKSRGTVIIATLSVIAQSATGGTSNDLCTEELVRPYLSPLQRMTLGARIGGKDPDRLQVALENVRRLHRAEVTVLAGTDAPNPGTAHGATIHAEIDFLKAAGLSPLEALAAATSRTAEFFGTADRGRVAVGNRADLLLLAGDPLTATGHTRNIVAVWKNGFPINRAKIPPLPPMFRSSPVLSGRTVVAVGESGICRPARN